MKFGKATLFVPVQPSTSLAELKRTVLGALQGTGHALPEHLRRGASAGVGGAGAAGAGGGAGGRAKGKGKATEDAAGSGDGDGNGDGYTSWAELKEADMAFFHGSSSSTSSAGATTAQLVVGANAAPAPPGPNSGAATEQAQNLADGLTFENVEGRAAGAGAGLTVGKVGWRDEVNNVTYLGFRAKGAGESLFFCARGAPVFFPAFLGTGLTIPSSPLSTTP